jgi:hypothetical protein
MNPTPPTNPVEAALAADVALHQRRSAATRQANAEPFPGPLAAAFVAEPPAVAGLELRPIVAGDFILFRKLDSPLYRRTFQIAEHQRQIAAGEVPENTAPPETKFDEEECVEMIYQLSVPIATARAALKKGRDAFRETALAAVTDRVPVTAFPELVAAVVSHFTAAFSTAVRYESPEDESKETVFTTPAEDVATASAGGLTTSRASVGETPPANPSSSRSCP